MKKLTETWRLKQWSLAIAVNVMIVGYFGYALMAPASTIKSALLPGTTSHGHHQIELDCSVCHIDGSDEHSSENVMQDACIQCHGEQLRESRDTHPAKKFNDPTNAELLLTLDAQDCLTCHREHVPEQTSAMGLTIPADYCWHCHQDVAESRPSHEGLAYDSCATAACHNYHDNRALNEKFLNDHFGEPDHLVDVRLPTRDLSTRWKQSHPKASPLGPDDIDAPQGKRSDKTILRDWSETAHAAAGVNCRECHVQTDNQWVDAAPMDACATCHQRESDSFQTGRHGMRLSQSMSAMTPGLARLPMHADAAHRELTCNACHQGHRFDTDFAAVKACQQCHADAHTLAYEHTAHANLWRDEQQGLSPAGSGVSCATCHLPRLSDGETVWVNHDQNHNLRPNETMAKEVCGHCHGLDFSLSALADPTLVENCFDSPPDTRTDSVTMAREWFDRKSRGRGRKGASAK